MISKDYWDLFLETGSPEFYLLYTNARKMETADVFNANGPGVTGHNLQ